MIKTHRRERWSATTHINDKIHHDHRNDTQAAIRFWYVVWSLCSYTIYINCYYYLNTHKRIHANQLRKS